MKLISMCDYISYLDVHTNKETDSESFDRIVNYKDFLQTPLELGMFIPCKDGEPISEDIITSKEEDVIFDSNGFDTYKQAKERVVFEGFYKHHDLIYFPNQVALETADGDFTEWQNIEWLISNSFQKLTLTPYKAKEFFPELLTPNP